MDRSNFRYATAILIALAALVAQAPAQAGDHGSPQICNRTHVLVYVAIAWWGYDAPGLHSSGWYSIPANECRSLFPRDSYPAHRYYFGYSSNDPDGASTTAAWQSGPQDGTGYCVAKGEAFEFADGTQCSPPYFKRQFVHLKGQTDSDDDYYDIDENMTDSSE